MAVRTFDKVTKAKNLLVFDHPFFSMVALRLEYLECETLPDGRKCETMATDMKRVFFSKDFVDKLTTEQVAAVIAHETLHVCFLHGIRRGPRDPLLWNIACDYAINLIVKDAGLHLPMNLPGGGKPCIDEKYRDWPAAKIYEDLFKDAKKVKLRLRRNGTGQGQEKQDGQGGGNQPQDGEGGDDPNGEVLIGEILDATGEDGKPLSDGDRAELEEEVKIAVKQAAENAKAIGKLPGSLAGLVEAVGKPTINWKEYIQTWVSGRIPDNYTWVRPNRKIMANYGIYMPRMQLNGAGVGVLSIDTSGSVSDAELRKYVTEIAGVIEICNPEKLYIIQHDAVIQDIYEWNAGDEFTRLQIKGRGGTCIQPSFKQAEKFDEQIDWMICFTDMEIGDWPKQAPDFPVLWAATGGDNAPFGTYINLRDNI
jgi:predicted metal-dependent peptidase